jgi:gliding motility-associated-like protein
VRLLFTLAFLILTTNSIVWGQGICNDQSFGSGGFSLGSKDFCHDQSITIANTAAIEEARYYYNYQGQSYDEIKALGSDASNFSFNSLTKSGIYTVIQVGKKDGKETVSCINDVKVRVANQPVFSYSFCFLPSNQLTISIPNHSVNDYSSYNITLSDNTAIPAITILPNIQTFNVKSAVTLTVEGIGGPKTCSTKSTPIRFNYTPISGNNLDNYPQINELKINDDDKIRIDFKGQFGEKYKLRRYPSTSHYSIATEVLTNLEPGVYYDTADDTKNTSYCYFVEPVLSSAGCILPFASRSAEICSIPLKVNVTDIAQNQLIWTSHKSPTYPPNTRTDHKIPSHEIIKIRDAAYSSDSPIISPSSPYRDQNLECKYRYCYRIRATTSGYVNTANYSGTSYSNEICVDHKEGPLSPPTDVRVSTNENLKNIVYFENPPSGSYPLDKWFLLKSDGTDFLQIDEIKSPAKEIPDNLSPVTRSETYKVKYQDICENESELSKPVTSVFLAQGGDNKLEWNTSSPFSDNSIKQYEIIYVNDDTKQEVDRKPEPSGSSSHTINTTPFTSSGTFKVRIIADDGTESFSNPISVPIKGALFLPTAFTPNGDGPKENEIFVPKGSISSIKEFLMEIFAINGAKIAEITDPLTGWDGKTSEGSNATNGVYFYKMTAVMQNGQIINKNGSFALLK